MYWLLAASPYDMNDTLARHKALVDGVAKATGMSRFLDKLKHRKSDSQENLTQKEKQNA